jgi:hypothetical protein
MIAVMSMMLREPVVESRKGAVTRCSVLRFPSHRVVGGGHPPPTPTERSVRSYRTTLFGS